MQPMHDPAKVDCAGGEPTAVDAPASAVFTGQGAPDTPAQGRFATVTELPSTLHPATIWLPSLEAVLGPLMPALFGSLFIGLNAVLLLLLVFVMLPTAAYHSLRYFTLRYQISESELVVQSGLVFRRERRIPYDRVQETEIKQSIIHRLLGLAKVSITTAGSNAREAGLNVLTRTAAEVLKESISSKQQLAVAHEASPAASGETAEIRVFDSWSSSHCLKT